MPCKTCINLAGRALRCIASAFDVKYLTTWLVAFTLISIVFEALFSFVHPLQQLTSAAPAIRIALAVVVNRVMDENSWLLTRRQRMLQINFEKLALRLANAEIPDITATQNEHFNRMLDADRQADLYQLEHRSCIDCCTED